MMKKNECHDLWLQKLSMDNFITKFTSLLQYVPYIREEKAKVQTFISIVLLFMKEHLEFDNLKTTNKVIQKVCTCYQKNKPKGDGGKR